MKYETELLYLFFNNKWKMCGYTANKKLADNFFKYRNYLNRKVMEVSDLQYDIIDREGINKSIESLALGNDIISENNLKHNFLAYTVEELDYLYIRTVKMLNHVTFGVHPYIVKPSRKYLLDKTLSEGNDRIIRIIQSSHLKHGDIMRFDVILYRYLKQLSNNDKGEDEFAISKSAKL